jgi:hypothetical protein
VARIGALLDAALVSGDASELRAELLAGSRLPGPRLNLALVREFAGAVGEVVRQPQPPTDALVDLLDGWAALPPADAPGDGPVVILPCAAVAAYGDVAVARREWWSDEMEKLRRAASDSRWRVREVVAMALQRVLSHDWDRTAAVVRTWTEDPDPLVVRAAAAAVAEPSLLREADRGLDAEAVQRGAVARLAAVPAGERRRDDVRTLRQALGFTISVVVAATGDGAVLDELDSSGDPDLQWVARQNRKKARLRGH